MRRTWIGLAILVLLAFSTNYVVGVLPQSLKSARMTDATPARNIDNEVGNLEKALCDILGIPCDTDITGAMFSVTAVGGVTAVRPFGLPSFTLANLLAQHPAGTAGRQARVTDGVRGIRGDTGVLWAHRNGERILAADFDVDPARTAAQNATGLAGALSVLSTRGGGSLVLPDSGIVNYDTTLAIPAKVTVEGGSAFSILNYTGTGDGMTLNNLGALTQWRAAIQRVKLTTSTGAVGIRLYNVYENDIIGNIIEGFSNAAIISDGNVAVFSINIWRNKLLANGRGIRFIGHNAHNQWSIVGNRIQGSSADAGLAMDLNVKSLLIAGNDIEGNLGREIVFTNGAEGVAILGNHFETNAGANDGITMQGAGLYAGIVIEGNEFANNLAGATGRAIRLLGTNVLNAGLSIKGNNFIGYGNTTNPAIDFNSQVFSDVDLAPNRYAASVTTPMGNFSTASTGVQKMLPAKRVAPIYGTSVAINTALGNEFDITATDGVAFTVANPTNSTDGHRVTITIRNTSGGALGAVTFDTLYKLAAWTSPATANSRSIDFKFNGTNWVEVSRTPADVPN